jgi:hypothetical protein
MRPKGRRSRRGGVPSERGGKSLPNGMPRHRDKTASETFASFPSLMLTRKRLFGSSMKRRKLPHVTAFHSCIASKIALAHRLPP